MNSLQNPLNANYPQDVTQKPGENAVFIVYALKDLPDTIDKVKDVCANFSALIRSMRNRYPDMQFSCTIGFGADAWKRFFPEQGNPKELQPFEEIKGVKLTAVSTPGDLLFHIRCKQMGLCFEFASIIDRNCEVSWNRLMRPTVFGIETVRRLSVSWTVRRILPWMKTPIVSR